MPALGPLPANSATEMAATPSTGTPVARVHAVSRRALTPGAAGRDGGPPASARAVTGRMIRSLIR